MKWAIWGARILLAIVFLWAGIVKVGISERFAITIGQFFILPQAWVQPAAIILPALEVLTGILLLIPRAARLGALAAAGLLVIFLITLVSAWSQGFVVDCGCFGLTEDEPTPGRHIPVAIARDVVLLALTLGLALRRSTTPASARN